jgi:hypothetical protein
MWVDRVILVSADYFRPSPNCEHHASGPPLPKGASMRHWNWKGPSTKEGLVVCIPSSEQKSALCFGALLLDIGQIDGVSFHQKLDGRRNDEERRNVDREYLKGPSWQLLRDFSRTLPHSRSQWLKPPDAEFRSG